MPEKLQHSNRLKTTKSELMGRAMYQRFVESLKIATSTKLKASGEGRLAEECFYAGH